MQCYNPFAYLNHLFLLISACKIVWQLPQNVRRSWKGWSSGAESFSHVPQESSWLVVPHDMSPLTPSVPVRCHTPCWSCSFDIWTDSCRLLLSLQGPPSGLFLPLFGSKFYICCSFWVHFNQIWPCFEQEPDPTTSRYPYFAPLFLCIHEDPRRFGCKLPNPWWNGAPSVLPTRCTAPPAPSWDRTILSAVPVPPEPCCAQRRGVQKPGWNYTGNHGWPARRSSVAREKPEVCSCSSSLRDGQGQITDFFF